MSLNIFKDINFRNKDNLLRYSTNTLTFIGGTVIAKYALCALKNLGKDLYQNVVKRRQHNKAAIECRKRRDAKIEAFLSKYKDSIKEERIDEIIELGFEELAHKIKEKAISSKEACLAYSIRLATVGLELCLITDVDFEAAISLAEAADKLISETDNINDLPCYIGVPITIKDTYMIKGMNNTIGLKKFSNNYSNKTAVLVEKMRDLGAIVLCLTNVPQSVNSFESSNDIFGNCQNPWDRTKSTGGSSGGCAGAVTSYCTPLSWGGDIAGSIRAPAGFCGCYGFKPSCKKISDENLLKITGLSQSGWKPWLGSNGPLTRKLDDILNISRKLFGAFESDRSIPQKKFDEDSFNTGLVSSFDSNKKIKIAINYENHLAQTMEDIKTNLKQVQKYFEDQGHEVITIDLTKQFINLYNCALKHYGAVFKSLRLMFDGEKPKGYYSYQLLACESNPVTYFFSKIFYKLRGDDRLVENMDNFRAGLKMSNNTAEYLKELTMLDIYREQFFNYIKEQQIDCIIAPIYATTALDISKSDYALSIAHYTAIENILNLSSGTVPLKLCEDTTYNSVYNDTITEKLKSLASTGKGLPISVQICTMPYQDERCLRIMKEVDSINKYSENKEIQNTLKSKVKGYLTK